MNFVHLIHDAYPILLEDYAPQRVDPIIRSIGHKNTMVNKAYLFEVAVGQGALLATSLKLGDTYDSNPQTRYLVSCFLNYACSEEFQPKTQISREILLAAMTKQSPGE